jgi:hypothetical protein
MPVVIDPPVSTLAGILGKEARHQWNDSVTMGDLTDSPRVKLDAIGGLQSLPDPEDIRESAMGRRGEITRNSFRRGKTVVYEGRVQARTLAALRQLMSELASGFDSLAEGRMLVTPHPDYAEGFSRFYNTRALTFEPGDEELNPFARWQFQQPFALALRMSDARFYDPQALIESTGAIATTGGLTLPFTPPVTFPETSEGAGSVTVTNEGNAAADPVIDIYGPVTNPTLSNLTLGRELAFEDLDLGASTFLRIDFATRQVLLEGTSDYRSKIDWGASDWWDSNVNGLEPGENQIQLRGDSIADPAKAQITFNPAYVA